MENEKIEMKEFQKQLIEGVQGVLSSEKWQMYLNTQRRFHKFSFNNTIMIMLQNSEATKLLGRKQWLELNREIKEDENPIKIFAPKVRSYNKQNKGKRKVELSNYNKGESINVKGEIIKCDFKGKKGYGIYVMEIDQFNYDDLTGYIRIVSFEELKIGGIYRVDGIIDTYKNLNQLKLNDAEYLGMCTNNLKGQVITGFHLVDVYDISQTSGEDLPRICENIEGDSEQAQLILDIIAQIIDIPLVEEDMTCNGYFSPNNPKIGIKKSLSLDHKAKTSIHEYAHYVVYKLKKGGLDLSKYTIDSENSKALYAVEECIVESIAFMVCKHFNLDTSNYSFEYIASWSGGNIANVKEVGGIIQKYYSKIIDKMETARTNILELEIEKQAV